MNVNELDGNELDHAVALALGWHIEGEIWFGPTCLEGTVTRDDNPAQAGVDRFHPSSSWGQGGPIIERERIDVVTTSDAWAAKCGAGASVGGPTPLIAAMRAFVASKQP